MADISQIKLPNGDTFDLIDEKSGYITAQYIENKTDYSIPVSRVGEIEVGETVIGTDSTNFPTSKAVVDYVDERVVQEIEAIDVPTKTSDLINDSSFITSSEILPPLVGTTDNITPTEVINALEEGRKVYITHTDSTYGVMKIYEGWWRGVALGMIGASAIFLYQSQVFSGELYGDTTYEMWDFVVHGLAQSSDIPQVYSSTNTGGYLTMATLPIYNGTVE